MKRATPTKSRHTSASREKHDERFGIRNCFITSLQSDTLRYERSRENHATGHVTKERGQRLCTNKYKKSHRQWS